MKNVLFFGETGNIGKEMAKELIKQGYYLTVVVRNETKATDLENITQKQVVLEVFNKEAIPRVV